MASQSVFGDKVLCEVQDVLESAATPTELNSKTLKKSVLDLLSCDLANVHLKRNVVFVWQCYGRKWRQMLPKLIVSQSIPLYTGSHTEGMPTSHDVDTMYVSKNFFIFNPLTPGEMECTEDLMRFPYTAEECHPGYLRIIVPPAYRHRYSLDHVSVKLRRQYFLKNIGFLQMMKDWGTTGCENPIHGPALTQSDLETPSDVVHAIPLEKWPTFADDFFRRQRNQHTWADELKSEQVSVVAVGYGNHAYSEVEFRLSFTAAELNIVHSWNYTQLSCYHMLKLFKDQYLQYTDVVCSYHLKTTIFWMSDIIPLEHWCPGNILVLFFKALSLLKYFFMKNNIPQYFIPQNNLIGYKSVDDCRQLGEYIDYLLTSGRMNVVVGQTICKTDMDSILSVSGETLPANPRSCRFAPKLRPYFEVNASLEKRVLLNEAAQLSSLTAVMAIWYRAQCKAMEDTCENLQNSVAPKMVKPFRTLLKRKIADSYHNLGLRNDTRLAREIYRNNVELIYPSGFDDMCFSGIVQLSFFEYLNGDKNTALFHLLNYVPKIIEIRDRGMASCYVDICLAVYELGRFHRDQTLYSIVKDLKRETPLLINTVVLALYILLQCLCDLPEKPRQNGQFFLTNIASLYTSFSQNEFEEKSLLDSHKLLFERLTPKLREELGDEFDKIPNLKSYDNS